MKEKILLSWSGGKDSCMSLYELRRSGYSDVTLITTITEGYDRISIHGVRRELLEMQADSLGLRLSSVYIPKDSTNEQYESCLKETLAEHREEGIDKVAFGDIFLEDLRQYRVKVLKDLGMKAIFPIWGRDTAELLREFIELGFKAVLSCINPKFLDGSFAGRAIDGEFVEQMPEGVDPCGENGEYHSFVYDGPIFGEEIKLRQGEVVLRDEIYYCELLP
ncbi:MAG: diphthine--ammonia ligase [Thermodesulfobacteriota bacterium]